MINSLISKVIVIFIKSHVEGVCIMLVFFSYFQRIDNFMMMLANNASYLNSKADDIADIIYNTN